LFLAEKENFKSEKAAIALVQWFIDSDLRTLEVIQKIGMTGGPVSWNTGWMQLTDEHWARLCCLK